MNREEKRAWALERLGGRCQDCGTDVDIEVRWKDTDFRAVSFLWARNTDFIAYFLDYLGWLAVYCKACYERRTSYAKRVHWPGYEKEFCEGIYEEARRGALVK